MENGWPKEFRYSLTYNGVTTVLQHEPDTWQDFSLQWRMDKLFWTRALSLGIPTKFVKDGKEIIDRAYREQGIGAKVMFRIEVFNYASEVWAYQTMYYNQLNFASLISERDYAELESEPQGLMQLLAKKGDQEFEIDMSDGVAVNYDRIVFNQFAKYHFANDPIFIGTFAPTVIIDDESVITTRGSKAIEFQTISFMTGSQNDIIGSKGYFMKCNRNTTVRISFDIRIDVRLTQSSIYAAPAMGVTIKFCDKNGISISTAVDSGVWSSGDYDGATMYSVGAMLALGNHQLNLTAGNEYYIIATFNFSGIQNPNFFSNIYGGTLYENEVKWNYRGEAKSINTITPQQLGARLMEKITDGNSGVFNFNIPEEYSQYAITCGDAIRGNTDAKIKTTFNDFYKSYSHLFQLGLDITQNSDGSETAAMKSLVDFFTDVQAMNLGEVTELRIKPWVDKIPSVINVGYKDNTYENSDGKGEFNTELQFSTPQTSKATTLDLMIPYRADSYGVEYVLIDFEKDKTADSKADNDVFLIHVNTSTKAVFRGSPAISGTYADSTMFNAILSPKSILLRNERLITSLLDKIPPINGKNVIFGSSKKDMDVAIGGTKERASERLDDDTSKIFKPIIIEFYTGLKNFNAYELLRSIPNGYFTFSFMGKSYKGHILELNVKPAINQAQDWQMICYNTAV